MAPHVRTAALVGAALVFTPPAVFAETPKRRPITVDDLFALKRVADPQVSPDGKQVAYQVTTVNLDANTTSTALWVAAADGKTPPRQVTNSGKRDAHPRWSPDGTKLLFESNRSGSQQLYVLDLAAGGEAVQITNVNTGAGNGLWSPDGSKVAFVSAVYPEFSELPFAESDKKNKEKEEAAEKAPVKAKVFTKLFYRHWDEYVEDKRQHLFVVDSRSPSAGREGFSPPRDVTPGDRDAYPTSNTFNSSEDFTFTPDGTHLVFTAVPAKDEAWSTNYDLCRVPVDGAGGGPAGASGGRKPTEWETLKTANPAADGGPRFSPDGKNLAWRSQKKAGYEADKWDILTVDVKPDGSWTGEPKNVTAAKDVSVNEFCWLDERMLAFVADEKGASALYMAADGMEPTPFLDGSGGMIGSLSVRALPPPPRLQHMPELLYTQSFQSRPAEVMAIRPVVVVHGSAAGGFGPSPAVPTQISHANDALLKQLDLPKPESVEVAIEGGKMQMWLLKPPGFDPAKKWPVVYLVHGGPQGAWEDGWSNRWNPEVWAAQGYVVAMPNPRGSTGFGQKFVDEISGDWGGKCYRDLVAGLDAVEKLPYVDKTRIGSAGASFGGYMMNWFAVNDIAPRFKCLITHCSVWNFESMWGTTDELWFDEQEHGGLPWDIPGKYREFSPHIRAKELGKHKTPMLVVHNDRDYRCPIGQGHELFSALQRQGVPSRFVNFPDEGHWVLKPKNSQFWHKEVFDWLTKHAPPGGR